MIKIKTINFLMIFFSIFILEDCRETTILDSTKETNPLNIVYDKPLNIYSDITIDEEGNVWFAEVREDTSVVVPNYSNTMMAPLTRICKYDGVNYFQIYDGIKTVFFYIAVDNNKNIWLMNYKEIMVLNSDHILSVVLKLNENDGIFQTIAVDKDDNVWVGGFNTGIYKFKNKDWVNYTTGNSQLPTNSINKIYVDKNNNIWIALWYMDGLLKIDKNNWIIYTSVVSILN
jgi:ligand-binding sensor domain-containing protein